MYLQLDMLSIGCEVDDGTNMKQMTKQVQKRFSVKYALKAKYSDQLYMSNAAILVGSLLIGQSLLGDEIMTKQY